jgi:cytochrome c-type biogenesis protein CcmH/NrfF
MTAFRGDKVLGPMTPAKWFYNKRTDEPTTEVAIRHSFAYDLYVVLAGFDAEQQSATFHVVVNPLVNWIWAGFALLAFGTLIALLPERALAVATAKAPAAATSTATTTTILLLALLGSAAFPHVAHAQHVEGASTIVVPMSAFEREIQNEIVCMCGTCGRKRIDECTCGKAEEMRIEVAGLVKKGYTREQVLDYYVQKYGSQEPLAMPIDKGFNRLAWAVPYALGVFGAVLAGTVAVRWTRRRPQEDAEPVAQTAQSEAWQKKLDEELRDLD